MSEHRPTSTYRKPLRQPSFPSKDKMNVIIEGNDVVALDSWIEKNAPLMSRSEALRYVLHDWLVAQGILPSKGEPEGDAEH